MLITSKPKTVFGILCSVIALLLIMHLIFGVYANYYLNATAYGLVDLFNMDQEHNIPTLFSSLMLLTCSLLLLLIATAKRKDGNKEHWYWHGMAAVFLFLSVDEITSLHERFNGPIRNALETSGALHFAWVIPYALLLLALAGLYARFVFKILPGQTRTLMILSAAIFIGGALGLELLGSYYFSKTGEIDLTFALMATVEEVMEMFGVVLFIYTLMRYLATEHKSLYFHVGSDREEDLSPATSPAYPLRNGERIAVESRQ
ncbi:hypothetical protein [Cesiribacter andamanensis]|uniref:Uncharacterized protein n=1 Tax=Cesiribacter andamanensis AMV16 TaxID=1279009 RepID=M7N9J6_9BACT|nr:hypothetical protein [Cesiribacter andamanensis]EMR03866.1 hypothetical protein ADICEAN_01015 [Cesiribacter andamanensis AMV16]